MEQTTTATTTGKKLVFLLPGNSFSKEFLLAWSDLLFNLVGRGYTVKMSCAYDANVFYARARCLCTETLRGVQQLPFNGELDYDFLLWIDSDVVFTPAQVMQLIGHDVDIVTGSYMMANNTHLPIVTHMDHSFYLSHGHYEFLDRSGLKSLQEGSKLVEISYAGMGFMCIKKGVLEQMTYPYFNPVNVQFDSSGSLNELASEDVSFCIHARDKGFRLLFDPALIVSHQKLIPLK